MLFKLLIIIPTAIVGGIAIFAVRFLCVVLLNRVRIALEPRPLKLVRRCFADKNPHQRIAWVLLSAVEPSRWIVGVFFGPTRPPNYKFFAVGRNSEQVTELDEYSEYTPK